MSALDPGLRRRLENAATAEGDHGLLPEVDGVVDELGRVCVAAAVLVASVGEDRLVHPNRTDTILVNRSYLRLLREKVEAAHPGLIQQARHRLLIKENHGQRDT